MIGSRGPYFNVQILIDFDGTPKREDVLCEVCEFPHVPDAIKHAGLFRRLDSLHLLSASLPGRHHGAVRGWPRDAMRRAADAVSQWWGAPAEVW